MDVEECRLVKVKPEHEDDYEMVLIRIKKGEY